MGVINKIKRLPKTIPHFHFWVVVIFFIIGVVLHYPQQLHLTSSPSLFSFLGLTRHSVERIFLILPVAYAGFFMSTGAGLASLTIASLIMLPRIFFTSEDFPDAAFETIGVVFMGGLINVWFDIYRKDKERRQEMLSSLEKTHAQLQEHTIATEKSENRLFTINQISNNVSQSLELSQILSNAISSVINLMKVDAAWIYLLNEEKTELTLAAHHGYSDEFSRVKVGYGVSGKVVQSGQPIQVEDVSKEVSLPKALKQQTTSLVVVPLSAKGKVNGTLGVHSRSRRYFDLVEIELLTIIGNVIGVAVDNAKLYEKQMEMQEQLRDTNRELRESLQKLKDSQEQLIQAEKLTSLGQLAASIAHEVNNPLSGILMYTQLLERKIKSGKIDNDTALDYLSKMELETTRSIKLTRSLLGFGRRSTPNFRQVSLNDIINRAFDLLTQFTELQNISVSKEFEPVLPDLMADSDQLQQVFTNLILNAIQAMPQGGKLTVRSSIYENQAKVEIQDTGTGISPENMRRLFTPFFTTKQEVQGVGLGLAVAYGIIQRHKGKIEVQSEVGEGTTFTICLPFDLEPDGL